ncbi:hypothetical protein HYX13_05535, partial [Candidatus Woesearchaeota archaeon]|nr:hypothetical protein [Candidatus Woesearchaeota archaeon]
MKISKMSQVLFVFILFLTGVYLVFGTVKDYVEVTSFNLSTGTASQGGGLVFSGDGITGEGITNGTSLMATGGGAISVMNITARGGSNFIKFNVSFLRNETHGNYVNVTFELRDFVNGISRLNQTVNNQTVNQSSFNLTFNFVSGTVLLDGIYNLSIYVFNYSSDVPQSFVAVNYSLGSFIAIDSAAPPVTFGMNFSNGTNFSASTFPVAVKILFTAISNDTTTQTKNVTFQLDNGNGTVTNLTGIRNASLFQAETTSALSDGVFTVTTYATDHVALVNVSIANVTFRIDRAAPPVTFGMNFTNGTNFSASTFPAGVKILFTLYSNDTVTRTTSVNIGLNNANGTQTNLTVLRNASVFQAETTNALPDGVYTVTGYANDTVNNENASIANVTFSVDRAAPPVTFGMNFTNNSNFSSSTFTSAVKILFTLYSNDT